MQRIRKIDQSLWERRGSRGNQSKFRIGDEFVKIDTYIDGKRVCVEGLCEVLCSRLLNGTHVKHVDYRFCKIQVNKQVFSGCVSENFIPHGAAEYTLQELFEKYGKKRKLARELSRKWPYGTPEKSIKAVVRDLKKMGIDSAESYLHQQLFFDTVFQNSDRHTNNYSFIQMSGGEIQPAPLFDFGMAFGSNTCTQYDPPKLFFRSGQDALSFLKKERGTSSWKIWGIPDHLPFSIKDFEDFVKEASLLYTENELSQLKYALCGAVLNFPDFFPNLDVIHISSLI